MMINVWSALMSIESALLYYMSLSMSQITFIVHNVRLTCIARYFKSSWCAFRVEVLSLSMMAIHWCKQLTAEIKHNSECVSYSRCTDPAHIYTLIWFLRRRPLKTWWTPLLMIHGPPRRPSLGLWVDYFQDFDLDSRGPRGPLVLSLEQQPRNLGNLWIINCAHSVIESAMSSCWSWVMRCAITKSTSWSRLW